ncbi:Band 7 protein family and Stomatin family-containing protein [Strongyloides ratti]|uniref:Band 7 protein family and Stomatin family-containing protein n=1 Tax=Strongyloides ratti TaxID=34506 RepID=A0A090L505_STRRB|nr:Band 7 protein family and Stomatin family-containing protein [Strongyloides ratti]CEF62574.1 Band 7 protein family and Stomatin family-containing protein [Strongyloides ratti]
MNDEENNDNREYEYNPGLCAQILIILTTFIIIITSPITIFFCIKIVKEYERAVIFRLGRLLPGNAKGPGLFYINPFIDKIVIKDMRVFSFTVPPQEILSKDSVTVFVDAVVYFKVNNAIKATINVQDCDSSTKLLAQTILRNITGTRTLAELLSYKENISHQLQEMLDEATELWGIEVQRVELKDVCIPKTLQRAMAAEGEAIREAKAKVIAANGEKEASKALKEAADIISTNSNAIQLRYLQTLSHIGQENNTTIVFPFPIEFMNNITNTITGITSKSPTNNSNLLL